MCLIKYLMLILIFFLGEIRTQNQIFITLISKGNHLLFCDDNINNYGTTNINIYQLLEDKKINISNELIVQEDDYNDICKKKYIIQLQMNMKQFY